MVSISEIVALQPLAQPNGVTDTGRYSPSLEAQKDGTGATSGLRHWAQAVFAVHIVPDDIVEEQLRNAIDESDPDPREDSRPRTDDRYLLENFLSDYERFKHRDDRTVCRELFRCYTFTDGTHGGQVESHVEIMQAERGDTFSEITTALARKPCSPCPGGLRVLPLTFEAVADRENHEATIGLEKAFFTATHRIIASFRTRPRTLLLSPNDIIAFLFARNLGITRPSLDLRTKPDEDDVTRRLLQPPSDSIVRGNFDPTQFEHNHIVLIWQGRAPAYKSGLDIFLHEQYKTLPEPRCAVITLFPGTDAKEATLLTLFRNLDSLRLFSSLREAEPQDSTAGNALGKWSATSETVGSICTTFKVQVRETTKFLKGCSLELEKLNLKARQYPSAGKLRYLVHLEDCRASAYAGVVHGLDVLTSVHNWIDHQKSPVLWDAGEPFSDRFVILRKDLEWFRDQLSIIGEEIKELQQTLHEHIGLTQGRRNYILSIVAAVYVTLSFTTSFFGMNMNTSTSAGPKGFTDWVTTWINDSPAEMQNSTKALVSTINRVGIQSYPWRTFGITAGSLLATIPLSLGVGGAVRTTWQIMHFFATYWRILGIPSSMAFILFSIFGIYTSSLTIEFI